MTLNGVETFLIDNRGDEIGDIDVASSSISTLEVDGNDRIMVGNTDVTGISTDTAVSLHDVDFDAKQFYIAYNDNDDGFNASLTLTDVDDAEVYIDFDSANDESSDSDVFNLTLDGVKNTGGAMDIYGGDVETFNVTVASDSVVDYIGFYYNENGSALFTGNVNLVLNGDLTVEDYWDVSDDDTDSLLTITGAGNLDMNEYDDSDGDTSINASAATGNIVIADINDEASFVRTGSGDDEIGLEGSATEVSLGDGDDKVTLGLAIAVDSAGATDVVDADLDGGEGNDTLEISAADAATSESNVAASADDIEVSDAIANFETLSLTSVSSEVIDATLWGLGDDVRIDGYSTGGSLTVSDAATVTVTGDGTTDYEVIVDGAATGNQSLNLTVNGAKKGFELNDLTVDDVETISIVSTASASGVTNTVDLIAAATTTLNISGKTELVFGATADFTKVAKVAAGEFDGGLEIDLTTSTVATTVTVGDGDDTITGNDDKKNNIAAGDGDNTVTGGTAVDTITTGSGDDTIDTGDGADVIDAGDGANFITGGKGGDTMTGGDDVDTYFYAAVTESNSVNIDSITNFDADEDFLDFNSILSGLGSYVGEANGFGAVVSSLTASAGQSVFDTSTDMLYVDVDGDAIISAGDLVIELTGVTSLDAANFVF